MFKTAAEAVAAAKTEVEDSFDYVEFDGMNCNDYLDKGEDECPGWDGVSYRCFCGNRRVSWETYGSAETGFTAFACAH
jgi:hypothetical protein